MRCPPALCCCPAEPGRLGRLTGAQVRAPAERGRLGGQASPLLRQRVSGEVGHHSPSSHKPGSCKPRGESASRPEGPHREVRAPMSWGRDLHPPCGPGPPAPGPFTPLAKGGGGGGGPKQSCLDGLVAALWRVPWPEAKVVALTGEDQRPVCCVLLCGHRGWDISYCLICLWLSHYLCQSVILLS